MNTKIAHTLTLILFTFNFGVITAQNTFSPVVYEPTTADFSTLSRNLDEGAMHAREASRAYAELCALIGKKYEQIHQDEETLLWFEENISSLSKKVLSSINAGNPRHAYDEAQEYIGRIYSNSELIARIKSNKEYTDIHLRIMNRTDLTYEEKKNWEARFPYKFVPIINDNGEVIGGRQWSDIGGPDNTPIQIP